MIKVNSSEGSPFRVPPAKALRVSFSGKTETAKEEVGLTPT